MKKIVSILMTLVLAMSFMTGCSAAEDTSNNFILTMQIGNPVMTVNGAEQNIDDAGTTPVIVNDRTLVPIRAIIEAMGGTVGWDENTQTATLHYGNDEIQLVINSETAYFNGISNTLDTAPVIINDRTMLPIRFIAESFKFDVEWEPNTQTITITKNTNSSSEAIIPSNEEKSKALVVYYSATGNTESVANIIATTVNADTFELKPVNPYTSADLNWNDNNSRVVNEHNNPELQNAVELESTAVPNWESYDTVFIGYPIWWGIAAWPVNQFVTENDFSGKTVIPFCTSSSSGLGQSGKLLSEMTVTGKWQEGMRFRSNTSENDVQEWAQGIMSTIAAASSKNSSSDKKSLIAYFSRAGENYGVGVVEVGNTARIAGYINDAIDADVFEIVAKEPYPVGYEDTKTRVEKEISENARPEFVGEIENIDQYDTIYLGYPIWYGTMPLIMNTFLEKYDMADKTIIPFSTAAGSGWGSSLADLKKLCPDATILDGYTTAGSNAANAESSVKDWLDGLKSVSP